MNYKELLDDFQEDKQCTDSFTEDMPRILRYSFLTQNRSSADQKFIIDTLYGCNMHKKLLDVVVNIFNNHHGKKLFSVDRNLFIVVFYLAMFCRDDLGLEHFSRITRHLKHFLSFFFNISNLTTHIQREWSHIYDAAIVKSEEICPKKSPRKNTKPRKFDLTQPKARPLPAPEVIPLKDKLKPVPATTHRTPKEPEILDEMKQTNSQQFRCANLQKSEKTQNTISQILQSRAELQFDKLYTSGNPATKKMNSLPVRLNTTAILQEGALYNRQLEEELESEPSAPLQWQKEMKEKDLQEELAELEHRRLEGRISHEEAVLARERVLDGEEGDTAELMRKYADKRLKEEKEMRELVQQVADGHKNSKAARNLTTDRAVKEVSEQSRELLSQALEEAQAELSRKMELICQIHASSSDKSLWMTLRLTELQEAVSGDERVLALQKTLEQKQQERQKRKREKKKTRRPTSTKRTFQQSSKKKWCWSEPQESFLIGTSLVNAKLLFLKKCKKLIL
uniref:Cilia and flagella associated protein 99 n=1 Tax=Cyprinus carpio TaxID=7962 RepID=A0A8C1ZDB5_CYPCA